MTNKDKTGNARQQARRKREKEWLAAHGYTSWEQIHTKLVSGEYTIKTGKTLQEAADERRFYEGMNKKGKKQS